MRATQAAPASTLLRRKRRVSRSRLGEEQRRRQVSGSREKTKSARCGLVRRANRAHYPRPAQPVRALPPPSSAAPLIRCVCRLPPTPLSLLSTQPRSRQISFEPALSAIAAYARITTHFSIILSIFLVVGRLASRGRLRSQSMQTMAHPHGHHQHHDKAARYDRQLRCGDPRVLASQPYLSAASGARMDRRALRRLTSSF